MRQDFRFVEIIERRTSTSSGYLKLDDSTRRKVLHLSGDMAEYVGPGFDIGSNGKEPMNNDVDRSVRPYDDLGRYGSRPH